MAEQLIGRVTHYFGKAHVAAIQITDGELRLGDTIHVTGHSSDFTQQVNSMQIEHAAVQVAHRGDAIGIQTAEHAREHDSVFRILAD
jgi:putative protease